jgi:hypothetical protein
MQLRTGVAVTTRLGGQSRAQLPRPSLALASSTDIIFSRLDLEADRLRFEKYSSLESIEIMLESGRANRIKAFFFLLLWSKNFM